MSWKSWPYALLKGEKGHISGRRPWISDPRC